MYHITTEPEEAVLGCVTVISQVLGQTLSVIARLGFPSDWLISIIKFKGICLYLSLVFRVIRLVMKSISFDLFMVMNFKLNFGIVNGLNPGVSVARIV